ncbi:MAG: hypothetical protein BWY80_00285 [Firmicutes bacterium ADurb.Bin456]|nr:MAG: hypothetical protein BWY80_00285 [Firmicutes bacterium ADurb.Bin456]
MPFGNFLHHGPELGLLGFIDYVGLVHPDHGHVCGYYHNIQAVNFFEFLLLGERCTGHSSQLVVHPEIILEGDGGQRLGFPFDFYALFGFYGLVQAVAVTPAEHQAASEFINDNNLPVLHHVIFVPFHQPVGLQSLVQLVGKLNVLVVIKVFYPQHFFHLGHPGLGDGGGMGLLIHIVIGFPDELRHNPGKGVVEFGGFFSLAGNDQGCPGLVHQNAVHFVHNGVIKLPLDQLVRLVGHVVPQVVEAELVVGAVGDIGGISLPALPPIQPVHHQTDAQPQKGVDLPHPLAVPPGQVVVYSHHMHALAGESV